MRNIEFDWKVVLFAGCLALMGVACSGDDGDNGDGNGNGEPDASMDTEMPDTGCSVDDTFTLSGTARVHPVAQGLSGDTQNLTSAEMRVQLASSALGGQFDVIRQTGACEDAVFRTGSDLMEPMANFNFDEGIDRSGVTFGVVATIDDEDSFGSGPDDENGLGDWVPTVTGLVGASPGDDVPNAQAFAVNSSAEAALAGLVASENENVDGSAGSLLAQGPALILFLDQNGDPVEGVRLYTKSNADTITGGGSASGFADAYYPSDDFMSVSVGDSGSTGTSGAVIATGTSLQTEYTGLKLDGDGNVTAEFTAQRGGSVGGLFYTITLQQTGGGS